jgi:nucleoside-diphosphate-sugar epimerase
MRALVLGASGATGNLVVKQLIKRQTNTRIIVRKSAILPQEIIGHPLVEVIKGNINELNDSALNQLTSDCDVIVSCLGHNITFKGLFGKPRYLVFNAIRSVCETAINGDNRIKLILMSTVAYTNFSIGERKSPAENIVLALVNLFLPPHRDNVRAANYLINTIGKMNEMVEWVAVRPDSLVNDDEESPYEIYDSPVRIILKNAGETSRINVGHFMAELANDDVLWNKWKCKTPVLYNATKGEDVKE